MNFFKSASKQIFKKCEPELFFIIGILWLGIFYAQLNTDPAEFPDTPGYVGSPKSLEGYFSLTGHAQRGWPTVLAFWLVNTDNQRALLQAALFAISWSLLIVAWFKGKSRNHIILFGGFVTVLALTPRVLQWNSFLLSESISVSLVVAACAMLRLSFTENFLKQEKITRFSFVNFVSSIFLFSLAAVNRASLIPLTLVPIFMLLIAFQRKTVSRKVFILGGLFALFSMVYPIQYNSTTNDHWSSDGIRLSRSSFYFIYNTSYGSFQPEWADMLWQNIENQAPTCLEDYRGSAIDPGRNPYYQADLMVENCPEGIYWLNQNFDSAYLKFIYSHPVSTLRYSSEMLNFVQDSTPYNAVTLLPHSVSSLFESRYQEETAYRPMFGWLGISTLLILYMMLIKIKLSLGTYGAAALVVGGLICTSVTQLFIVSEPVRITTPSTTLVILSCLLLISECKYQFALNPNEEQYNRTERS